MKSSYKVPDVVNYDLDQIMELIGPATTQYACNCAVQVGPASILRNKEASVRVSVSMTGNPSFTQVEISVPGSTPLMYYAFDKKDGDLNGDTWEVTLPNFIQESAGNYDVQVTLLGGTNGQTSCTGTIGID